MTLLLALLVAAAPLPAPLKLFGDWTAACDNGARCEAVSMIPENKESEASVFFVRDAGPAGAATFTLAWQDGGAPAGQALTIDGKRFALPAGKATGEAALAIARALAAAKSAEAVAGAKHVPIFTTGASAAMRYLDAGQGRAGTTSAIVARGAGAAPPPPVLPVVEAVRSVARKPAMPSAATLKGMRKAIDCDADPADAPPVQGYAIDATHDLVLLACASGAYNVFVAAFVGSGGRYAPAPFDAPVSSDPDEKVPTLANAEWRGGLLTQYAKSRGIGDCGLGQSRAWDGTRFRLVGQTELDECRGGADWPSTWLATVVRR